MKAEFIDEVSTGVDLSIDHPQFYPRLFQWLERRRLEKLGDDPLETLVEDQMDSLSRHLELSGVQDACTVRNVIETRSLACLIITDEGKVDQELLERAIAQYEKKRYSLGPDRQYDALRKDHILKVLKNLEKAGETRRLLRSLSRP